MILVGITIVLLSFFYVSPVIIGSYDHPLSADARPQSEFLMDAQYYTFPNDFYVELKSERSQVLNVYKLRPNEKMIPLHYKDGNFYRKSYVYKITLNSENDFNNLKKYGDVTGIWLVPQISMLILGLSSYNGYGDIDDALSYSGAKSVINSGVMGDNTIIVLYDAFPSKSIFYDHIPASWSDRIIHYPSDENTSNDRIHGIMTTAVAGSVSPNAKLYFMGFGKNDFNPLAKYQKILELKNTYPNYNIISSNSFCFSFPTYYIENDPINQKILELTNNDITVVFGAGNWAHQGEHDPKWTYDVGYDQRNTNFNRDDEIGYPATFYEVISVAGCTAYCNKIMSYSSLGKGIGNNNEPDVSTPTHFSLPYSPYDGVAVGTSASCPFMAGICSLILSGHNTETSRMIGSIHSYSTDEGKNGYDMEFGYGSVNAVKLFNNYNEWTPPLPPNILRNTIYIVGFFMIGLGIVITKKEEFHFRHSRV